MMLTCWGVAACSPQSDITQSNPSQLKVQQVEGEGFKLDIYDNSATFSQILTINASGQMIGMREVVDEAGTLFSQEVFFLDQAKATKIPLLPGFTNVEVLGLSDSGLVVGYASRPMGHAEGSLTGMVWDSRTGHSTRISPFPGDISCYTQAISADGQRLVGYSAGSEPPRMRPCVWNWNQGGESWEAVLLDSPFDYNPYLMASRVAISPDGLHVAACVTVAELPNNMFDSSLHAWDWSEGQWQRRFVSDEQMYLYDMNNHGTIAGVITTPEGRKPCVVDSQGGLTLLELLPGDESGEARGIDSAGMVVGFSDDPAGPSGGPQAFVWRAGVTQPLELPEGTMFSAAYGLNEHGQIGGLLDVALPQTEEHGESDEPTEKTLAFRWTPKPAPARLP